MKEKTVVIEIDEQGNSSMDLEGFQGSGCSMVARDFQGADTVTTASNKREFCVAPASAKRLQERELRK